MIYHNLPQPQYGKFVGREAEINRIFALLQPYPRSIDHRIVIDGIGGIGKSTLALEVAYRCLQTSRQTDETGAKDDLVRLRKFLEKRFNEEELRTLCFDMALDYEMLPGQGKGGKVRELVAYLDRRNRISELMEQLRQERPKFDDLEMFGTQSGETNYVPDFEAIIWISAKRTMLTGEGIIPRHQSASTLADIYRAIAIALERDDILKANTEEQKDIVRKALTLQRTFLILDNLETVDDEQVMNFLQDLPAPTKLLITTRHRISTAIPVRLTGMPWEEAEILIHQECNRKGVSIPEDDVSRLFDRTGGLPLAIIWSIAQIGFGYGLDNVLTRLGSPTNDVVRFCFEGTLERIRNRPAYKLLLACSMFTNDVSREGLGYVTELPLLDQDDGLAELERLSLVNKKGNRFSLLSLTRIFVLAELENYPDFVAKARMRWIEYLKGLFKDPQNEYYWRYSNFDFYQDGENILEAVEWAYEQGKAEDVFYLSIEGFYYLENIGDWNRILSLLQEALELIEATRQKQYLARVANTLGVIYAQQGYFDKAMNLFEMSLQSYRERISLRGVALTLQHQSMVYRKQGQFEEGQEALDKAMHIAEVLEDGDLQVLIESNYGKIARDKGDWNLAWEHFSNVRDYFENRVSEFPRDEFLARSIWGQLAYVALELNQPQQAKAYCLQSIEFFEREGAKGTLNTLKYRLALAEMALEEYESAQTHLLEAMTWFERLGMRSDLAQARLTQQQLIQHME